MYLMVTHTLFRSLLTIVFTIFHQENIKSNSALKK